MTDHYPGHLMQDYEMLLEYFPSHEACRQPLVDAISKWKREYQEEGSVDILEVGPGHGDTTELILDQIPALMTLVETDEKSTGRLAQRFKNYAHQLYIMQADATQWIQEQPSSSYDVCTASWVIHNFPKDERKEFLKEVQRVLRPGGLFVIFEKIVPDDEVERARLFKIGIDRLKGLGEAGRSDLERDMVEHETRDNAEPFVWTESELMKTMKELDFIDSEMIMRSERDVVFKAIKGEEI